MPSTFKNSNNPDCSVCDEYVRSVFCATYVMMSEPY